MKHLRSLKKYFRKYLGKLFFGILFIILSNYFRILSPQLSGYIVNKLVAYLSNQEGKAMNSFASGRSRENYDWAVRRYIGFIESKNYSFQDMILVTGVTILALAIVGGLFMFLMRQTIIVMSRLIEYDQKNEIFNHYQMLDLTFYKKNATGDLMNRISEDVSRVRMYTGPAIMYFINLTFTIGFCVYFMWQEHRELTLYVLSPLPLLAYIVYRTNKYIHRKSESIQEALSMLTTIAQESYSGIRVLKSFMQEKNTIEFFREKSIHYRDESTALAKVESVFFPSMSFLIGFSIVLTVGIGGWYHISGHIPDVSAGTITEFVIYVNMLTFPVTAIGWTASLVQRAAASQKRIDEFLNEQPIVMDNGKIDAIARWDIKFNNIDFVYSNTGIKALSNFSQEVKSGEKVLILGKTGSGKTTVAQLMLRFYDPSSGEILIGGENIRDISLREVRKNIAYVAQDNFLFSDTILNNISFGMEKPPSEESVVNAAKLAMVHEEIMKFENGYQTLVGERGVTLSGGQKQRVCIARALLKNAPILILDDCLSAVDTNTENNISKNLATHYPSTTIIVISHRIPQQFVFDKILVLDRGKISERGNHDTLIDCGGKYAELYKFQKRM